MSRIFKYINDQVDYLTGWYRVRNNEDVTLRLSNNNSEFSGSLRFNNNLPIPIFQGYDGSKWVDFNAVKGDRGDKGTDFNETITLTNLKNEKSSNIGNLFSSNYLDKNEICIRSLESGVYNLNNKFHHCLDIKDNNNGVSLTVNSRPHIWNLSNVDLINLKSNKEDLIFKCYGSIVKYQVAQDEIINKGQVVTLDLSNNKLCIKKFSIDDDYNEFIDSNFVVGVALQDCLEGQSCLVCTEGITTVKVSPSYSSNYLNDNEIKFGSIGLINENSCLFKSLIKPKGDYIKLGWFLEEKNTNDTENQYYLFYVKN